MSIPKDNLNEQISRALSLLRRVTSPAFIVKPRAAQNKNKARNKAYGGKVKKRK